MERDDVETLRYGPLIIERRGRVISFHNEMSEKQHKAYKEKVKRNRPKLKKQIDKEIEELLQIFKEYNPFQLLEVVTLKNGFVNPEEYTELTYEGHENHIEYALSLALLNAFPHNPKKLTPEKGDELLQKIENLFRLVIHYYGTNLAETGNLDLEADVKFTQLLMYTGVRGDSYAEHHEQMLIDIFRLHEEFLKRYFGFTVEDLFEGLKEIEKQTLKNIDVLGKMYEIHHVLAQKFTAYLGDRGVKESEINEQIVNEFRETADVKPYSDMFNEVGVDYKPIPFEIVSNEKLSQEILDNLSCQFGHNSIFASYDAAKAWPNGDSIIYEKGIVKHNDRYYCFGAQILFRNVGNLLEKLIQQKDENYFKNKYSAKRSEYLEDKTIQYLEKLLPNAKVFRSLYYYVNESGQKSRVETDGLIFFDNNIFIVEAKAGDFSKRARRGDVSAVKQQLKELVGKAYNQGERTKRYILDTDIPVFENESGEIVLEVKDKSEFKNFYIINSTLENLGPMVSNLQLVKELGIIDGLQWPWTVYINDLKVISEIIASPSQFILFLQRRLRVNDFKQFKARDELDLMMIFLKEGLYLEKSDFGKLDVYQPGGYTEDLDRYYDYKAGRVSTGKKPEVDIEKEFIEFVSKIESSEKLGFTDLASLLYSIDYKQINEIWSELSRKISDTIKTQNTFDVTVPLSTDRGGLTIFTAPKKQSNPWIKLEDYCEIQMYRFKATKWYTVLVLCNDNGSYESDFKIYDKEWIHSIEMDMKFLEYEKSRLSSGKVQYLLEGQKRKIGRNDKCLCGSNKKYKKCCGRNKRD